MNIISKQAQIGSNVKIGEFTIVHDNVVIGDDSIIESHCVIGSPSEPPYDTPLVLGADSRIGSHSVFYEGSTFGPGLRTGHAVLVRGGTVAGKDFRIGTQADIEGQCVIGDHVRTHSHLHIAKTTKIGDFVWIYPRVTFMNDPLPPSYVWEAITVQDMAVICTGASLLPGIDIGKGAFVAAGSVVHSSVPEIHCVSGNPAKPFATLDKLINFKHGISYPWPKHFNRGYPESASDRMSELAKEIQELMQRAKNGTL
jgi:acetyltransferase-like isoleucine patch superfamily enzyme